MIEDCVLSKKEAFQCHMIYYMYLLITHLEHVGCRIRSPFYMSEDNKIPKTDPRRP